jgi:hypothetical protein
MLGENFRSQVFEKVCSDYFPKKEGRRSRGWSDLSGDL